MKKIIIFVLCVFLITYWAICVIAQAAWDYNSAESYKNPDFLRSSDPSKWDVKKVDWSNELVFENPKIYQRKDIYSNPQVYSNPAFYRNLPEDKYNLLDYKKVQFDKIEDHRKIDGNKYLKDLGCKNCKFDVPPQLCKDYSSKTGCLPLQGLERGTLQYSSNGIRHKNGDFVSVPGDLGKAYSTLIIGNNDNLLVHILMPSSSKNKIGIPQTDSFTLLANGNAIKYGDIETRFDSGKFILKNGAIYAKQGSDDSVNGLVINSQTDVRLYFDGQEHGDCKCNYISMDKIKKIIVSGVLEGMHQSITFFSNDFIKMQAPLKISQTFGTITAQNNAKLDLIPSIAIKFDSKPNGKNINTITDGEAVINIWQNGAVKSISGNPSSQSNPLVVSIENFQGISYLGTKNEPKKIIIDDKSNIADLNYNDIARLQPSRLYYSMSPEVENVIKKSQQTYRIQALIDEIATIYSVPPNVVTIYLDESREAPIIKSIITASQKSGISAEFLTGAAFKEGLSGFMESQFYLNPNAEFSSSYLGLHDFSTNVENLKKEGFLRKDFNEYSVIGSGRTNTLFSNVNYAMEAFAASMAQRQAYFLNYARSQGYDSSQLSEQQIDYWTYFSYNCGEGCVRGRVAGNIDIPKITTTKNTGRDPDFNSKRVLATAELQKRLGLFDRAITQKIAKQ